MRSSEDASVSVVVPTYNSANVLADCLRSIQEQAVPAFEVIVSDGGSTDETVKIARGYEAIVVQTAANRSAQRNAGAERATGTYLLFVDSDMVLTRGVIADCLATFKDTDAAFVIPEIVVGDGFWAKVRGFERSFYDGVWYIEAARWYRRSQFLEIGGFDTELVGGEDWDLDQRIRKFGDVRHIKAHIEHNEGHITLKRLLQKKGHYSNSFDEFRERHPERAALSFSTLRRVSLFARQPSRLLEHPLLATGVAVVGIGEVAVMHGWLPGLGGRSQERPISTGQNTKASSNSPAEVNSSSTYILNGQNDK